MEKSAVFFTDFHATPSETLPQKLHRLLKRAGFEKIDFADHYAAIKIHFGELGNLAHLRPQYAKVVVDYVRELGGKRFSPTATPFMSAAVRMPLTIWIRRISMAFLRCRRDVM